jgi:hypothetical protein
MGHKIPNEITVFRGGLHSLILRLYYHSATAPTTLSRNSMAYYRAQEDLWSACYLLLKWTYHFDMDDSRYETELEVIQYASVTRFLTGLLRHLITDRSQDLLP